MGLDLLRGSSSASDSDEEDDEEEEDEDELELLGRILSSSGWEVAGTVSGLSSIRSRSEPSESVIHKQTRNIFRT